MNIFFHLPVGLTSCLKYYAVSGFFFKLENNKFWTHLPKGFAQNALLQEEKKPQNNNHPLPPVSGCIYFSSRFLFAYLPLNYQHHFSFLPNQMWIITKSFTNQSD